MFESSALPDLNVHFARLLQAKQNSLCPKEIVYGCTIIACLISTLTIIGHLFYYNERSLQKYIIRILFMIPVYSVATLGSIQDDENHLVYSAIRDFYEAYVLYTFMQLLIAYLGGYKTLVVHLEFKVSYPKGINTNFRGESSNHGLLTGCNPSRLTSKS